VPGTRRIGAVRRSRAGRREHRRRPALPTPGGPAGPRE
jgi:hypothetical protein